MYTVVSLGYNPLWIFFFIIVRKSGTLALGVHELEKRPIKATHTGVVNDLHASISVDSIPYSITTVVLLGEFGGIAQAVICHIRH